MSHADKKSQKPKRESGGQKPTRRSAEAARGKEREAPLFALRSVQAESVALKQEAGETGSGGEENVILLQDPEGFAPAHIVLSSGAYALATLFDGERTATEVSKAFAERYGQKVPPDKIQQLSGELDQALFLESPRFEAQVKQELQRYLETPLRPAMHSGVSYPADPDQLRQSVEGYFALPDGPGALGTAKPADVDALRGLMLPHIDLRVGGATYAHGYRALLERSQADLFVILGVAHQGHGDGLFNVSAKDYATPLGPVKTARGMARRLQDAAGVAPTLAEFAHKQEHSVEFQAVLMTALLGEHAGREFEIVPVLCGSVEPFLEAKEDPQRSDAFVRFVEALRNELDASKRRWCIVASVDLSHVGPKFGHSTIMTDRLLLPVERADRRMLATVESLDPDKFYFEIMRNENSRHIDAVLALLTLLAVGKGTLQRASLLHYDQMLEAPTKSAVTFASMAFE